jgi:hypothetical protein
MRFSLSSLVMLFLALIFALAGVIFGLGRRTLSRIAWWEVYMCGFRRTAGSLHGGRQ